MWTGSPELQPLLKRTEFVAGDFFKSGGTLSLTSPDVQVFMHLKCISVRLRLPWCYMRKVDFQSQNPVDVFHPVDGILLGLGPETESVGAF